MASYAYTAINAEGLELRGEVQAPTAAAAREQLRVQGLLAELLQELPSRRRPGATSATLGSAGPASREKERQAARLSRSSRGSSRP